MFTGAIFLYLIGYIHIMINMSVDINIIYCLACGMCMTHQVRQKRKMTSEMPKVVLTRRPTVLAGYLTLSRMRGNPQHDAIFILCD